MLYGRIAKIDGLWQWSAAPDKECAIRQMRSPSRWDLVFFLYDKIKEYNENGIKKSF